MKAATKIRLLEFLMVADVLVAVVSLVLGIWITGLGLLGVGVAAFVARKGLLGELGH